MNRRTALKTFSVAPLLGVAALSPAADSKNQKRLGIGMHSFGFHWRTAREKNPKAKFSDALEFLDYCSRFSPAGVQVSIGQKDLAYAKKMRSKIENNHFYYEGQCLLPRDKEDLPRFETDIQLAKEAGASVVRTACLSGRRYEIFDSADAFKEFRKRSWQSLQMAEPVLRKHRIRIAVENHKDWLVEELLEWFKQISSEFVGICVDTGNSIALMEDPMAVVEAYAPYVASVHLKDMAVQTYEDGFLLSEIPLGEGYLDLKKMISTLSKANPKIQFNLEMITRDPLKIPCLTEKYWSTMESMRAQRFVEALKRIKEKSSSNPLPRTTGLMLDQQLAMEEENARKSFEFARKSLVF